MPVENARTPAERFQADACPMPPRLVLAGDAALIRQANRGTPPAGRRRSRRTSRQCAIARAGRRKYPSRRSNHRHPHAPRPRPERAFTQRLRSASFSPAVGILLLSTQTQIDDAVEPFPATATRVGYLLKDSMSDLDELTGALTRISEGSTVLDPSSSSNCSRPDSGQTPSTRSRHENARCSRSWPKGNRTPASQRPSG